jgi:hypothetical protein
MKRGRKKLPKKLKRVNVGFTFSKQFTQTLNRFAKEMDLNKSEWVEFILSDYLTTLGKVSEPR